MNNLYFYVFCNIVRHKVKDLVELVQDDDRLKQERKRSKKNRDKYKGVSNEDYTRSYSMLCYVLHKILSRKGPMLMKGKWEKCFK